MERGARAGFAAACGLYAWAAGIAVQVAAYFGYLLNDWSDLRRIAMFMATLPLLQAANLAVAAVLAGLAWLLGGRAATRWVAVAAAAAITMFVLADLVYFKIFFAHIEPHLAGGLGTFHPGIAVSSFTRELDVFFWITAAFAAAATAWLARAAVVPPAGLAGWWRRGGILAVLFVAGVPGALSSRYSHLNEHPVLAAISGLRPEVAAVVAPPVRDRRGIAVSTDERFAAVGGQPGAKKNVVLIVLESVGARQLLDGRGLPDAAITPVLAGLAREAVVFPNLYTVFPGSTRSAVFLHTGGRTITWGGEMELRYPYQGPTLASTFRHAGYATALFSSMRLDGENSDTFLRQTGFAKFYDIAADYARLASGAMVHSWGGREEDTVDLAGRWLDERGSSQPFLLVLMTAATHHPYGTPADYTPLVEGDDRRSRYLSALHYTDRAIGYLLAQLHRRGLLANTVIAVTGDHGQAFGDIHGWNFTHKHEIYEENVRDFLLVANAGARGLVAKERVASAGDILPTLAAAGGIAPPAGIPGRNLLSRTWEERPVFFHKSASPAKWGMRDGRWKFISTLSGEAPELYDLEADPDEQRNIAGGNGERVAAYLAEVAGWYHRTNAEFTEHLQGYRVLTKGRDPSREELATSGAKLMATGRMEPGTNLFREARHFSPDERPFAWTKWAGKPAASSVMFEWLSPGGRRYVLELGAQASASDTIASFPGPSPLERGPWKVALFIGGRKTLGTDFTVR